MSPYHVLFQPVKFDALPIPWYETPDRAREVLDQFPDMTFSHLEWASYVWPGGYEIHYYTRDSGVLCHNCANDELMRTLDPDDTQFYIVDHDCNYEDDNVYCDHCNRQIKPAYGEDEDDQANAPEA